MLFRSLHLCAGAEVQPCFRAGLWNDDSATGYLAETVLTVESGGQLFKVPVRDVAGLVVPLPEISEAVRARVRALVGELGSREWKKREAASAELVRIGLAAKPLVRAAIAEAKDPEVRRRLEAVLDEINGVSEPAGQAFEIDENGVAQPL